MGVHKCNDGSFVHSVCNWEITGKTYKIYFTREVGDGSCFCARGSSIYERSSYSIETEGLKRRYDRQ